VVQQQPQETLFSKPTAIALSANHNHRRWRSCPDSAVELTVTAFGAATKAAYDKVRCRNQSEHGNSRLSQEPKFTPQILEQNRPTKETAPAEAPSQSTNRTALINRVVEPCPQEHDLDGQPIMGDSVRRNGGTFVPSEDLTLKGQMRRLAEISWKKPSDDGTPFTKGLLTGSTTNANRSTKQKMDRSLVGQRKNDTRLESRRCQSRLANGGDLCRPIWRVSWANEDGSKRRPPLPNAASGDR
jgi:hypothetical protein